MNIIISMLLLVSFAYTQQLFITKDLYYESDGNDSIEITTNLWNQRFKWKLVDSTATINDDYDTPSQRGRARIGTKFSVKPLGNNRRARSMKIEFNLHDDGIEENDEYVILKLYRFVPSNGYDTLRYIITIRDDLLTIMSDTIIVDEDGSIIYSPIIQ